MGTITRNEIKNATILSIEEYDKYKSAIPPFDFSCWLRSHGNHQNCADSVTTYGSVTAYGSSVKNELGVRPVLICKSDNLKIGEEYTIKTTDNDIKCTAIDRSVLITNAIIEKSIFSDNDDNDYSESTLKKYVDRFYDSII